MTNMSLKWRIILPVAIILFLGIALMVLFTARKFSATTIDMMRSTLIAEASRSANLIKADMDGSFGGINVLAAALGNVAGTSGANRDEYMAMMMEVNRTNSGFFGIWTAFEPNEFDGRDAEFAGRGPAHDATGRFIPYMFILDGKELIEPLAGYDTPGVGDYYLLARDSGQDSIMAPYYYEAGGKSLYVTTAAVPIRKNNRIIGAVGADLALDAISEELAKVRIMKTGYALLVDHNGTLVHHPDPSNRMKTLKGMVPDELTAMVDGVVRSGKVDLVQARVGGRQTLYVAAPLPVAATGHNWAVVLSLPMSEVMAPVNEGVYVIVGIGIALLVLSMSVLYVTASRITRLLNRVIRDMEESAGTVSDAAGMVSRSSQNLAEGATEQAASLEETSSALEQMASMTRQNAENAKQTDETMAHTNGLFRDGSRHMEGMTAAMNQISNSSEQIGHIIKTIEDIAFQTNLLALNAAVEAARAGEAGKGFAVVADEVRNLAQRSAQAAGDTTNLIEQTIRNVEAGVDVAQNLDASFSEIQNSTETISRLVKQIADATGEQAQGVEQVNTSMAQMDKVTQETASNAEESASASEELSSQAERLKDMVEDLVELVVGARRRRRELQHQ